MSVLPKVGVIGVGTIGEALTIGLSRFDDPRAEFLLSPRNEAISRRLAARFPNVTVAHSNQAVVDGAEIIILAVRPQIAEELIGRLQFRAEQRIVSLVAAFSTGRLAPLVAPATDISRAVPMPPAAERRGPLGLYTQSDEVLRLFDGLGRVIRVEEEAHLDLMSAGTSLMATYFGLAGTVDGWMSKHGFDPEASRAFVGELFLSLAVVAKERSEESFERLSADYSTLGGLNEQAWRELRAAGWPDQLQAALDLLLDRIHGRASFETQLSSESGQGPTLN
jgi:pyrroline-5-carboxylate reductase